VKAAEAQQIIEQHVAGIFNTVPVVWENAPLTDDLPAEFVSASLDGIDTSNVALGPLKKRSLATLLFEIFVPTGTGTRRAAEIADELALAVENRTYADIRRRC